MSVDETVFLDESVSGRSLHGCAAKSPQTKEKRFFFVPE